MKNKATLASSQKELETIAHNQYRAKIVADDQTLAEQNYWSSTAHGRALFGEKRDGELLLKLVAQSITDKAIKEEKQTTKRSQCKKIVHHHHLR